MKQNCWPSCDLRTDEEQSGVAVDSSQSVSSGNSPSNANRSSTSVRLFEAGRQDRRRSRANPFAVGGEHVVSLVDVGDVVGLIVRRANAFDPIDARAGNELDRPIVGERRLETLVRSRREHLAGIGTAILPGPSSSSTVTERPVSERPSAASMPLSAPRSRRRRPTGYSDAGTVGRRRRRFVDSRRPRIAVVGREVGTHGVGVVRPGVDRGDVDGV